MAEVDVHDGAHAESTPGAPATRKPRLTGLPLLIAALGVVLLVQALFVTSYIGALHSPKPHRVAFGVVGTSPMPTAVGKQFSLETIQYPTEAAARHAIDQREIYGAFVAGPTGAKLIVAPAASTITASALGTAFAAAAAAFKQRIAIVQVHPLPRGDAGGIVSFLLAMVLVVGGYLSATMAMAFGGPATKRRRLVALACAAVLGGLVTDTIAGPVIGAIPTDKFLVLWGLFILVMMAVAFATAALQTLLGPAGTLIVIVVFIIFGAPAAGGTIPTAFLPTFWRTVGPYLPVGAGTTAIRNTIYFDGNAITKALSVLAAYLVLGAVAVLATRRRHPPGTTAESEAEAEAAAAAVVIA